MKPKRNNVSRALLLILFFLISQVGTTGRSNQSQRSRFVNYADSPVVLEAHGDSHQVRNTSKKEVAQFTLACVRAGKSKRSIVVLRFPTKETKILPGEAVGEIRIDSPSSREICVARNADLSVIEVMFSDGSRWIAPTEEPSGKPTGGPPTAQPEPTTH